MRCRMGAGTQFWFKAAPGNYRLRIRSVALEQSLKLTVWGLKGGEKALEANGDRELKVDVEVGDEAVRIQADHYLLLKWLTLIEQH